MKLKLHHEIPDILDTLTSDFQTTVIILSGAERSVLDEARSWKSLNYSNANGFGCKQIVFLLRRFLDLTFGWQQRMECS